MILNWNEDFKRGDVANEIQRVDINIKPVLEFDFDHLNFDEMNTMKMVGTDQLQLTEEEIVMCQTYIDGYDFPQMPVHVADLNGFYEGQKMPFEVTETDIIVEYPPSHPAMVWENEEWVSVYLMVNEKGQPQINPPNLNEMAYYWTENNPPSRLPVRFEIWDFEKKDWVESRSLEKAIYNAKAYERNANNDRVYAAIGKWIPMLELETWRIQEQEARDYLADNSASTPFLDACLAARTDSQTKDNFVEEIITNVDAFKVAVGKIHGEMYNRLNAFEACQTVAEVDALGGTDPVIG